MKIDMVPGPMWSVGDYLSALGALQEGLKQLKPDGCNCSICGDSDHQAWECRHNPLVKMARADKADTEWRCFICGEVFTDEKAAFLHFGGDAGSPPGCRSDELTTLLRWAELQKHDQTAARPDENVYKRMLVTVWDQVIGKINEMRAAAATSEAA